MYGPFYYCGICSRAGWTCLRPQPELRLPLPTPPSAPSLPTSYREASTTSEPHTIVVLNIFSTTQSESSTLARSGPQKRNRVATRRLPLRNLAHILCEPQILHNISSYFPSSSTPSSKMQTIRQSMLKKQVSARATAPASRFVVRPAVADMTSSDVQSEATPMPAEPTIFYGEHTVDPPINALTLTRRFLSCRTFRPSDFLSPLLPPTFPLQTESASPSPSTSRSLPLCPRLPSEWSTLVLMNGPHTVCLT